MHMRRQSMNMHGFLFHGAALQALPSGALFWPQERLLVVSDLHFGKSARLSAVGGAQLPPYDTQATLEKLQSDLDATQAARVICLGDSFDAPGLDRTLPEREALWIAQMQAGRDWTWIEGNHDPGPVSIGGAHRAQVTIGDLTFRHIATGDMGEVSGHYHPKLRLTLRGRSLARPCFLVDDRRLILPAFGAYTGGMDCTRPPLRDLMGAGATAILTGTRAVAMPLP